MRITRLLASWFVLVCAMLLAMAAAQAADTWSINWERRGQFEACLEDRLNTWVFARAELVVNEDPAAADVDDIDVALWAVATLQDCEVQAGNGSQTSEQRFSRHMAHWRDHIHTVAQTVQKRVKPD
jgi:hypothetical protein